MILRNLARTSAAALLAVGVVASAAVPALAGPTEADISVAVEGLPLDSADTGRLANLKITNKTSSRIDRVTITYDFTKVDLTKVSNQLSIPQGGCEGVEGRLVYVCEYADSLGRNETVTDEQLPLAAIEGVTGPAGVAFIEVEFGGRDTHIEDNRIEVPIVVAGPASQPTPAPTGTPTAAPTGTASPTVAPTATPAPGGGNGGGDGGGLPVTGPAAIGLGLGGLAAIALGAFLYVAARRRRARLVTPDDVA
jgi:septal ring-binding cell division protein DamX